MFSDKLSKILKNVGGLFEVFNSFQEGSVVFSTGNHAVEVITRNTPTEVWLTIVDSGEMAVCMGGVDKMSYTVTPAGFILYVEVVSDHLQVGWVVDF